MDLLLFAQPTTVAIFALLFVFFTNCLPVAMNLVLGGAVAGGKKRPPPQPPQLSGGLPVIGHMHHFLQLSAGRNKKPLPRLLGDMSDRMGPVFMLRLGLPTVIVSDSSAARELFTANDRSVSSRPSTTAFDLMGLDGAVFSFSPYGPYWRSMRKIAVVKLLSAARLDYFSHLWVDEIAALVADLHAAATAPAAKSVVEMNGRIFDAVYNIMLRVIVGKRYFGSGGGTDEARQFRRLVAEYFRLLTVSVPADVFPSLAKLDLGGHVKAMRAAMEEMEELMQGLLEEHKLRMLRRRREGCSGGGAGDGDLDFMDLMMMSLVDEPEPFDVDDDTMTKSTSLALILGGMDTTTQAATSAVKNLMNNLETLRKLATEIDGEVGRDRPVAPSDIQRLPYLQAVVKESMRLSPTAPVLVPRLALQSFRLGGFTVPEGAQLIVNAWKVQRDPRVWSPDPEAFRPERFLVGDAAAVDVKGVNHELIPFGSGRRGCPGVPLAMQVIPFLLARLVQAFNLGCPGGVALDSDPSLDPFDVVVTPRLPAALYNY